MAGRQDNRLLQQLSRDDHQAGGDGGEMTNPRGTSENLAVTSQKQREG